MTEFTETLLAFGFCMSMFVAFFFMIHYICADEERMYQRRLNEAREFGMDENSKHTIHTLSGKTRKRK